MGASCRQHLLRVCPEARAGHWLGRAASGALFLRLEIDPLVTLGSLWCGAQVQGMVVVWIQDLIACPERHFTRRRVALRKACVNFHDWKEVTSLQTQKDFKKRAEACCG